MATEVPDPELDYESQLDSQMCLDPVIFRMYNETFDDKDIVVGAAVRTLLKICWLKQVLKAEVREDDDSLLAALRVASDMHEFGLSRVNAVQDYADELNIWLRHAQLLESGLETILTGKTLVWVCGYLNRRIGPSSQAFPKNQKQNPFSLLPILYHYESRKIYHPVLKAAKSSFQVSVVTWLKFCGGLPKVVELLNIPDETTLHEFYEKLNDCTNNDHVLQLLGDLDREDGLRPSDGTWLYQVLTDGVIWEEGTIENEQDYSSFKQATAALGENQQMRIIHELMARVPAAIRAMQHDDDETLTPAGRVYPQLPAAFQSSLEDEPIEGGLIRLLADTQALYQEKDDHAFIMEVVKAIGIDSDDMMLHYLHENEDNNNGVLGKRRRRKFTGVLSQAARKRKRDNLKAKQRKRRALTEKEEDEEDEEDEEVEEVEEQQEQEEEQEEEQEQEQHEEQHEEQEKNEEHEAQIVPPNAGATFQLPMRSMARADLQFPLRPKAVARGARKKTVR